jgi:hypothetical protein
VSASCLHGQSFINTSNTCLSRTWLALRSCRVYYNMAAMMPSASTSSAPPYDNDAVERDLIDPDDGTYTTLYTTCMRRWAGLD